MIRKICPCLSWLFSSPAHHKIYNPSNQLEEEEFMHQIQSQGKRYEDNMMNGQTIPIEEQLEHQLKLDTKYKNIIMQTPAQEQEKKIEEEDHELLDLHRDEEEEMGELIINIPEYDQNYNILKEGSHGAQKLLDTTQNCTQIPVNSLNAKNQSKLKINKSSLRAWRKADSPTTFVFQYTLPCSYTFYNEIVNKKITAKDNNSFIREFKLIESLHPNVAAKYICFHKIGMLEARSFTYLKYTNTSQKNRNGHWELCISKDMPQVIAQNSKLGTFKNINYIRQISNKGQISLKVKSFVDIDIGTTLQKIWEKIFIDVKSYVEFIWEEAAQNYQEELV